MDNTIAAIKETALLPVSIIIVGVGAAGKKFPEFSSNFIQDFKNMRVLDDDDGNLGIKRDCVQFVPFRQYASQPIAVLARDTLAEVPAQLMAYMDQHRIRPNPRVVAPIPVVQQIPPPAVNPNIV